jgi:phage terminase large subunit-like protein
MARPEQIPPATGWHLWLLLAGRGFGKTRTAAEWLAGEVIGQPHAPDGSPTEWAIIAETFGDTRQICVEGPSGLLGCLNRRGLVNGRDYSYNRSAWRITFPTGQKIHMLGADDRDAGRGFNLAGIWADEIAKWRYPYETWTEGLAPALRIGANPRAVITTTPKPGRLLKEWTSRDDGSIYVTRGSTFDNAANLSPAALTELRARYEGTRIGRQELLGELLTDVEGALWSLDLLERTRVRDYPDGQTVRTVVAIDPAMTAGEDSAENGIIVASLHADGHAYVRDDVSLRGTPVEWATRAVRAYREWDADAIVVEGNQGGLLNKTVIHTVDPTVNVRMVTARASKRVRAEPVSALYEQGRVHHVGVLGTLEEQLTTWVPTDKVSPDRLDALVWSIDSLLLGHTPKKVASFAT